MQPDELLSDLTPSQREAVTHGDGPLLVVAGPGSGKTRVITRRIAHLIARGVHPTEIIAITFTNKSAQEMARRVVELGAPAGSWVKTFHSSCAAILRRFSERAGLLPGFSIFDTQDQTRVLRGVIKRMDQSGTLKPAQLRGRISRWKTEGTDADAARADAAGFFEARAADAYAAYEQELAESNAVDFDDLLVRALKLLREDDDVRGRLQQRFRYVLIDEYQDTSPVQFALAAILADPQRNICATGDPDQSIYAFRNADVRNILEFAERYDGAKVVSLEENFRSVATVLRCADALIQNNRSRHPKKLIPTREEGVLVRVVAANDEHEEGQLIAKGVLDAYARGIPYRDLAVFYRVNAQSRALETALRTRGVPYMIVKGVEFYQRAEVKDLLAYLRVLANPNDRESMTRVLTTPKRGVGAKSLEQLFGRSRGHGIPARQALLTVANSGDVTKRAALGLREVEKLLADLEARATGSVAELLRELNVHLSYEVYLKRVYPEDWQDRVENVQELISGAAEYDASAGETASLREFLQDIALVADADQYDPDMPRVALMTLHSAKGLEFPEVFIAGVEEELLPHGRSKDDADALEEERRLLFVGITRAKDRLTMSFARTRRARLTGSFGGGASSFLMELPDDAIDFDRESMLQQPEPDAWSGSTGFGSQWSSPSPRRAKPAATWEPGVDAPVDYDCVDEEPGVVLRAGLRVRHAKFGNGTIRRIEGIGERAKAVVFFRGEGEKTLLLSYAKLTPISDA